MTVPTWSLWRAASLTCQWALMVATTPQTALLSRGMASPRNLHSTRLGPWGWEASSAASGCPSSQRPATTTSMPGTGGSTRPAAASATPSRWVLAICEPRGSGSRRRHRRAVSPMWAEPRGTRCRAGPNSPGAQRLHRSVEGDEPVQQRM